MSGNPERGHYVQSAYLEGFTDQSSSLVWTYRKGTKTPVPKRPEDFCFIRGYYRYYTSGGKMFDLERSQIFTNLESQYTPLIRALSESVTIGNDQRRTLARYLALSILRTPAFEAAFLSGLVFRLGALAQEQGLAPPPVNPNDLKLTFTRERERTERPEGTIALSSNEISMNRAMHVRLLTKRIEGITRTIEEMDWRLLHAPMEVPFITTDNPWAPVAPDGQPFRARTLVDPLKECNCLLFPLRRDLCLKATGSGRTFEFRSIDSDGARWVNAYVSTNAHEYVITSKPDLLQFLPENSHWS